MTTVGHQELKKRLDKFSNLPSIPQIIIKIKQISENPKSSAADLANCILSDHQLTSRILRMANSAYYGDFAGKITTVTHGIILMGFRAVRNIAISMAVYEVVNHISKDSKFDITAFWTRSIGCGVIAKFLASRINQPKLLETAFIAGFMHDIGQAILAVAFIEEYEQISKLDIETPDIFTTERVLLGIDHMQAGQYVAQNWNLPQRLVKAIAEHHRVNMGLNEKSDDLLIDLVYLGDCLYPHVMTGSSPTSVPYTALTKQARNLIGVSAENMTELLTVCRKQIAEIAKDLEINIASEWEKRAHPDEDTAEIHRQLNNKEVQLAFLQNATSALVEAKSDEEIQQVICEAVYRGLQMGRVVVFGYNERWESFTGLVGFGLESQEAVQALSFSAKKGLFGHLRSKGTPLSVVGESNELYGPLVTSDELERLEARAFVAVPIHIRHEVRYVIFVDAPNRETPIDDDTLRSITSLANQGSMAMERNHLEVMLQQRSDRSQ